MSLLADLLSKIKTDESHGGDEAPSRLEVPPTLSRSHSAPPKVGRAKIRYGIIAAVSFGLAALGVLAMVIAGKMGSSARKGPAIAPQAAQPARNFTTTPFDAGQGPPAAAPPAAHSKTARIDLGTALQAAEHRKTIPAKVKCPLCPPRKAETPPPRSPQPQLKAATPAKIDTAERDSYLYAARSAEQASDWRSALASYRRALEFDPGNYRIMSNISAVFNNLGMFGDGVKEAERALAKKPNYVPALINAAIGYSSRAETNKALRLFTAACAIDPGNRSLIINLGIMHERAGNLDDAIATYRQLAASGDPMALLGLGRIYEKKGNRAEAVRVYRQIMAQPTATLAQKKEAKTKLAWLEE
jgi:Tfp pilus assembly protein PilF